MVIHHINGNASNLLVLGIVNIKYWVSDTSKINGKYVKWYIEDRTISPSSQNDINYIDYAELSGQAGVKTQWTIGAYKYPQIGRFNLVFYDYETYQDYYNFIFKH